MGVASLHFLLTVSEFLKSQTLCLLDCFFKFLIFSHPSCIFFWFVLLSEQILLIFLFTIFGGHIFNL